MDKERREQIATDLVHACFKIHKELGPGLLEKVYEICLSHELEKKGYNVARQVSVPIVYDGKEFKEGFKLDLLIDEMVICEIKAQENIHPVWQAQIISHLKLTGCKLGFLVNFNVSLIKNGIRRFVN